MYAFWWVPGGGPAIGKLTRYRPGVPALDYRSMAIRYSASWTAVGEIFNIPLKGEYISMMMKIAAETASAQIISVRTTVEFGGAKIPKLTKIVTSHDVTTTNSGVGSKACSDSRNMSQYDFFML